VHDLAMLMTRCKAHDHFVFALIELFSLSILTRYS